MSDVFKALADPTRREILLMLSKEPTNVNSIVEHFDMSRPAISRHIKVLRESNLVSMGSDSQDGRHLNCYAQLTALKEVEDYIKILEKFWNNKLDGLGKFLDSQNDNVEENL